MLPSPMLKLIIPLCLLQLQLFTTLGQNLPPKIKPWINNGELYSPPSLGIIICEASGTGSLEFEWYKDGKKIIMSASSLEFQVATVEKEATMEQHLSPVLTSDQKLKPEHEGFYQCRVKNTYGTAVSDLLRLRKNRLEEGKNIVTKLEVNVGDSLKLPCPEKQLSTKPLMVWQKSSDFSPPVNVFLDERIQVDNNGTLSFSYVIESDHTREKEKYRCVLTDSRDGITTVVGSTYEVKVNSKVNQDPTSLNTMFAYVEPKVALIGGNVTLGCFYSGAEEISITITDAQGHNLADVGKSKVELHSRSGRKINLVEKSYEGEYSCTGISKSNSLKKTEKLRIIVQAKPTFIEEPTDRNATHGRSTEFKCIASAEPPAQIQWFKNGEPINENNIPSKMSLSPDGSTLKVENLCKENCPQQNDLMVIQCNASNIHGYAFANGYLNVLLPTEITQKPQDVEYNSEESATFNCDAKTDLYTKLTFKWLLNDKHFTHGSINTTNNILRLDIPNLENKGKNLIGKWTCLASNNFTSDAQSAYLKEKYVPAYIWPYWWAVLLALLLFLIVLLIICIVCCCLYRNRGDQYPVDEIEQKNGNDPEKELEEAGFHDYQRDLLLPRSDSATGTLSSQERTISRQKRSQGSLSGTLGRGSNDNVSG